jgi:hypothetical protein
MCQDRVLAARGMQPTDPWIKGENCDGK